MHPQDKPNSSNLMWYKHTKSSLGATTKQFTKTPSTYIAWAWSSHHHLYAQHVQMLQYLGPRNHIADQPGRRSLRSAGTSCLGVQPIRLSTVANHALPSQLLPHVRGMTCLWKSYLLSPCPHSARDWRPSVFEVMSWILDIGWSSPVDLSVVFTTEATIKNRDWLTETTLAFLKYQPDWFQS